MSDTETTDVAVTETADVETVAVKTPVFYIEADGTKTLKGRGRPRAGWIKNEDGNFVADPNYVAPVAIKSEHFYVTFDAQGNEVERKAIGRGRPAAGFTKQENGDYHKTLPAPVEPTPAAD